MADTIPVTLYLSPEQKQRIDALKTHGFTLNGFIRAAIDAHLARFSTQPNPEELARLVSRG
jgi:predicted DNA-binding protein